MTVRIAFKEAVFDAIAEEMRADASVFYMATNPPATLIAEFGPGRV